MNIFFREMKANLKSLLIWGVHRDPVRGGRVFEVFRIRRQSRDVGHTGPAATCVVICF